MKSTKYVYVIYGKESGIMLGICSSKSNCKKVIKRYLPTEDMFYDPTTEKDFKIVKEEIDGEI